MRDRGWVEFSVYPLFSPQSLIAEGHRELRHRGRVSRPAQTRPPIRRRLRSSATRCIRWPASIPTTRRDVLGRADTDRAAELRRQRSGATVSRRRDRRDAGGGLAGAVRNDAAGSRRAAREVLRHSTAATSSTTTSGETWCAPTSSGTAARRSSADVRWQEFGKLLVVAAAAVGSARSENADARIRAFSKDQ